MEAIPEEHTERHQPEAEKKSDKEEPAAEESRSVKPLVLRARMLLNRWMRVDVEDGRTFLGRFHCLDKQGNIILADTVDQSDLSASGELPRRLGLVLIPARHRTSCQFASSLDELTSLLTITR